MATYTSKAEGLKIKEFKDYYDWNDEFRITYNPNSAHDNWVFTVISDNEIWMNGLIYPKDDVIVSFKDGVEVNYTILSRQEDEETGSITNTLYRITSSISTETAVTISNVVQQESQSEEISEDELPDEITYTVKSIPNGSHKDVEVKKYKNGTLVGTSRVTPDKIVAYKVSHSQAYFKEYPVFNHIGFLWHGMNPESGYPAYSYTIMSRCDHLEVDGSQYGPHDYIRTWTWDDNIDITIYDYSTPVEPYEPVDDGYPEIQVQFDTKYGTADTLVVSKITNGVVTSRIDVSATDILNAKLKGTKFRVYDNFLLDWHGMNPESGYPQYSFTLISDSSYIKNLNGNPYFKNSEIKTWQRNEIVSLIFRDETNKHSKVLTKKDVFNVHLTINGAAEQTLKKGDGIYTAVFYDHVDMYYNGHYHVKAWLAYDQPNISGHYKTLGNIAIGWCRPYWVLITTAEGIYFNGHTYKARKLLKTWDNDDPVHLTLTQKKARKKTEIVDADSEILKYTIITDDENVKIHLVKYINDVESTKSTFDPTLVEKRTFNGIKFEILNGKISMYSSSDYVKFQNEGYKAKSLITEWLITDKVNYEVYDKDFNKIQYIMDTSQSSNVITISKMINDLTDDSVEFNPETSNLLDFHNIQFKVKNGKISIYSKSDFVKLSGSTYKKGNLIITWPIEEKVYFAIVDESIKYEVITQITYEIETEQITEIDYNIETIADEQWKPLRVQKKVPIKNERGIILYYKDAEEEIINYYDCVTPPYKIYDGKLQFEFNLGYYCWYLKSASDDIYINNVQYPAGTLIRSWNWSDAIHYTDIGHIMDSHKEIRLKSTTVDTKESYKTTHEYLSYPTYTVKTNSEDHSLILTCDQPGSSFVTHYLTWHEIHSVTWYSFYGLQFNYTQANGWKMRANNNKIVVGNKLYKKGDMIYEWGYDDTVDYNIGTLTEDIKHTERTDVEKALLVSTADDWLYGYIWEKEIPPLPPSWDTYDFIVFRDDYWNTRYVRIKVENNELVWEHGTLLSWAGYAYSYGLGLFNNNYLNECYLGNTSNGYKITFNEFDEPILTSYNNFYKMPYEQYYTEMIGIINNGTSIAMKLVEENGQWYIYKYIANTTNDIMTEEHILVGENYWDVSVTDDRNNLNTFLINNKLYFITHDSSYMTIFVADTSYTHMYNYGYENFVEPLETTISNIYPLGYGWYTLLNYAASFEHNGYIYQFISCYTGNNIYKPALIKINASNGTWQFVTLTNTDFYSDVPESDDNPILFIRVINSNDQIYLYVNYSYNLQFSTYIYRVEFTNEGIEINRRNSFIRGDNKYVSFKYGNEIARCYPQESGDFTYDSNLGCYVFGTTGLDINRRNFSESNVWCDTTVRYSGGLLGNIGKGNYIIGKYYGSSTTMFIAKLGSLDLTDSIENEVFTVGQFS